MKGKNVPDIRNKEVNYFGLDIGSLALPVPTPQNPNTGRYYNWHFVSPFLD
jgi:hypothetical protein